MLYHGKGAKPKVTVQVTICDSESLECLDCQSIDPGEEQIMDAYLHPFFYLAA
jgi:hypothetical protein